MINVNQITSQLAMMSDPALQKYAMLNKSDPYTVSLALSESNRRKAMRQGAAPKPGPQPKVVDQDISQMASVDPMGNFTGAMPENTGIGQIPAPNMQSMGKAEGGIVGYAGGGHVPSYAGPTDGSLVELPGGLGILSQGSFGPQAGNAALEKRIAAIQANPRMSANDKTNLIAQIRQEFFKTPAPAAVTPTVTPASAPVVTPPVTTPAVTPTVNTPAAATDATPTATPSTNAGQPTKPAPAPGLPSVSSFANQLMGVDKFLPKKEELPTEETFMTKRQEASAPVWSKFESTINKEKDRLNEGKEQDFYMALIEGGLAAAGGTSPSGLQNLAQGFSKGAGSYKEALRDFRKASQENSKMELDMERARAAEKRGDMDAFQKAEDSVKNRNADIDKLRTSGIFALQNVNTSGAYQLESTRQHVAGTIAAHGMPTGVERMVSQMPGKTFEEKLKAYSGVMGPEAKGDSAMLIKYMSMNPAQKLMFKKENPQVAAALDAQLQTSMLKPVTVPNALP
jgi:hypothetical protein